MVPKKGDEDSVIMKSVSVTEFLSRPWHWATCFSYIDQRLGNMLELTQLVSHAARI